MEEYGYAPLQDFWTTTKYKLDSSESWGQEGRGDRRRQQDQKLARGKSMAPLLPPQHHMKLLKGGPDQVIWERKDGKGSGSQV